MSTIIMAACWPLDLPHTAKFVLVSLADNANDQGYCWPSIDTIAKRTSLHRATVIRAVHWLVTNGLVEATNPGNGKRNSYRILVGNNSQPVAQRDRSQAATGRREQPNQSQRATGPVAACDTNRNEPSRTVILRAHAREKDGKPSRRKSGGMTDALEYFAKAAADAPR